MAATKTSDETSQATIAGAHMRGINSTPADRKFPGYAFWGEKGTSTAGGTTITLPDDGDFVHITGTSWTCTDIDFNTAKDGRHAWLEFDGAGGVLTHNATTLNLPGGANITVAAGDRALVVQDSGDNVHVLDYIRAAQPVGGVLLDAAVATTSGTSWQRTSVPAWVTEIEVHFIDFGTNGSSNVLIQIGDSGGYETSGYNGSSALVGAASGVFGAGFIAMFADASDTASGVVRLTKVGDTTWSAAVSVGRKGNPNPTTGGGYKTLSDALDRVRVIMANGTDAGDNGSIVFRMK